MKATGIVRKIDDLGRVVLPVELRRTLGLELRDPVEILCDDGAIILRKYEPSCVFCGSVSGLIEFHSKLVCADCRRRLTGE